MADWLSLGGVDAVWCGHSHVYLYQVTATHTHIYINVVVVYRAASHSLFPAAVYDSEILDGGDTGPVFRVTPQGKPELAISG